MIRQAIVVAGGRGTRLGPLAREYGNKCLVPTAGKPLLQHTLGWLKDVGVESIIVTVNYVKELGKISALLRDDSSVAVIGNLSRQNSAQSLPSIRGLLDPRFFFVYGHAPVPPEHLEDMDKITSNEVVASLYATTSQRERAMKPARLCNSKIKLDESGSLFIEPPHILNHDLLGHIVQTESWKKSFLNYQGPIYGVHAMHPPEYHGPQDLEQVRAWVARRLGMQDETLGDASPQLPSAPD